MPDYIKKTEHLKPNQTPFVPKSPNSSDHSGSNPYKTGTTSNNLWNMELKKLKDKKK